MLQGIKMWSPGKKVCSRPQWYAKPQIQSCSLKEPNPNHIFSVHDDTTLQKVLFIKLKMAVFSATITISLVFHYSLSTTICQVFTDSQITLKWPVNFNKSPMHFNWCFFPFPLWRFHTNDEASAILNLHWWF